MKTFALSFLLLAVFTVEAQKKNSLPEIGVVQSIENADAAVEIRAALSFGRAFKGFAQKIRERFYKIILFNLFCSVHNFPLSSFLSARE